MAAVWVWALQARIPANQGPQTAACLEESLEQGTTGDAWPDIGGRATGGMAGQWQGLMGGAW